MEESTRKTIGQMAIDTNNKVWNYLGKENISKQEIADMLESAYTSLNLWSVVGKEINIARGHWLVSRAQAVAGNKEMTSVHAEKCDEYTNKAKDGTQSFDIFYSTEALARSYAMSGNKEKAMEFVEKSKEIAKEISDKETRDLCVSDLKSGPWFDLEFEA